MNRTSLTLFLLAAACLLLSFMPWPVGETQTAAATIATTAPTPLTPDGATLFVAKGCVSCHPHDQFNRETMDIFWGQAPNLSNYSGTAEFLRVWLKDPRAVRTDAEMPNLGLKEREIEALIAFLVPTEAE